MKALGLSAEFDSNFSDAAPASYYYNEVGAAKSLGIINGKAYGLFYPNEMISRQDLFVTSFDRKGLPLRLADGNGSHFT